VPPSADTAYLDSSALVKLVVLEPESAQLQSYLADWPRRASSSLARVELVRAVRARGDAAVQRARRVLTDLYLVRLDDSLLDDAADLDFPGLRSLDAVHLASARKLRSDLNRMVAYDRRLTLAAEALGITVDAPGT